MIANIFKDGKQINRIAANESFARVYCQQHGYTYTLEEEPEREFVEPEPEPIDETTLLRAQVAMLQEQQTFLEDCLLEMAEEVYA